MIVARANALGPGIQISTEYPRRSEKNHVIFTLISKKEYRGNQGMAASQGGHIKVLFLLQVRPDTKPDATREVDILTWGKTQQNPSELR